MMPLTENKIKKVTGGELYELNAFQQCIQLIDCQTGERWNDWQCKFKFVPCITPITKNCRDIVD
jgi:hypothetical protein